MAASLRSTRCRTTAREITSGFGVPFGFRLMCACQSWAIAVGTSEWSQPLASVAAGTESRPV
jgi:hypothetical protein